MPRLCLTMIVKNEARIIDRCLHAVAPYLDRYTIRDTGSTDGMRRRIQAVMAEFGVPGEIHQIPFHNFEQARNATLAFARETGSGDEFLLLCDANMELVVEDREFKDRLDYPFLSVRQVGGYSYNYYAVIGTFPSVVDNPRSPHSPAAGPEQSTSSCGWPAIDPQ